MFTFLDGWIHYHDETLPKFSGMTFLYFAILLSSFAIAFDLGGVLGKSWGKKEDNWVVDEVAVIGGSNLGADLAVLFTEEGIDVSHLHDEPGDQDGLEKRLEKKNHAKSTRKFKDYKTLCDSLSDYKLIILSLPPGPSSYKTLEALLPNLTRDDVIIDCKIAGSSAEDHAWRCRDTGVRYINCVVKDFGSFPTSAGISSQISRDLILRDAILTLVKSIAAEDKDGHPCMSVAKGDGDVYNVEMALRGRN